MPPQPFQQWGSTQYGASTPATTLWNNATRARFLVSQNGNLRSTLRIASLVLAGIQLVSMVAFAAAGWTSGMTVSVMLLGCFVYSAWTTNQTHKLGADMVAQVPTQISIDDTGIGVDGQFYPWGSIQSVKLHRDNRQHELKVIQLNLPTGPRYLSLVDPMLTAERQPVPVAWFVEQLRMRRPLTV